MKIDIDLVVNPHEPVTVSQVVTNGETMTLEAGEGLLVEATPTLYENDLLDVQLAYYEQRGARKRRLTTLMSVSPSRLEGAPKGTDTFSVITGSKAYAVKSSVSVAAL